MDTLHGASPLTSFSTPLKSLASFWNSLDDITSEKNHNLCAVGISSLFSLAPSPWQLKARFGRSAATGLGHETPRHGPPSTVTPPFSLSLSLGHNARAAHLDYLSPRLQPPPHLSLSSLQWLRPATGSHLLLLSLISPVAEASGRTPDRATVLECDRVAQPWRPPSWHSPADLSRATAAPASRAAASNRAWRRRSPVKGSGNK
jgi:hypothetical protein